MNEYYIHHAMAEVVLNQLLYDKVNKLSEKFRDTYIRVEQQSYNRKDCSSLWIHSSSRASAEGEFCIEIIGAADQLITTTAIRDYVVESITVGEIFSHEGTLITIASVRNQSRKKNGVRVATQLITTIKYVVSPAPVAAIQSELPQIPQLPALNFARDMRCALHAAWEEQAHLWCGHVGQVSSDSLLVVYDTVHADMDGLSISISTRYVTKQIGAATLASEICRSVSGIIASICSRYPQSRVGYNDSWGQDFDEGLNSGTAIRMVSFNIVM